MAGGLFRITKSQKRKVYIFFRCVGISIVAWLFFSISNNYVIPVKSIIEYVNLPEARAFHPKQSDTVHVKLEMSGWQLLLSKFNFTTPHLKVDLSALKTKNLIVFNNQLGFINRQFPHEKRVVSVSPDTLFFDFSKQYQRRVPIHVPTDISFKRGFGLINDMMIRPEYITITGPAEDINSMDFLVADTIRGKDVDADLRTVVYLNRGQKNNINVFPNAVEVTIPVGEMTEKLLELPIRILNGNQYTSVRTIPTKVNLKVLLPVAVYNDITSRDFEAMVDVGEWEKNGVQYLPVHLKKIPEYCQILSIQPQNVDFFVRK